MWEFEPHPLPPLLTGEGDKKQGGMMQRNGVKWAEKGRKKAPLPPKGECDAATVIKFSTITLDISQIFVFLYKIRQLSFVISKVHRRKRVISPYESEYWPYSLFLLSPFGGLGGCYQQCGGGFGEGVTVG